MPEPNRRRSLLDRLSNNPAPIVIPSVVGLGLMLVLLISSGDKIAAGLRELLPALPGLIILGVIVIGIILNQQTQAKARAQAKAKLEEAELAYENALSDLTEDPGNPHLRRIALELGRIFAALCREDKKRVIFDEVALKNDLDAACAGAGAVSGSSSVEDRLERLQNLYSQGLVTKEEYQARRKAILDDI